MTRRQVAQLLGKSVTAARRLEGGLLFPAEDAGGVWRFDPREVENLAAEIAAGQINLWTALNATNASTARVAKDKPCAQCTELRRRFNELESNLNRA